MTQRLFDITDRVALVTGSSRGIGRALAQGLAEAGAVVVLNARNAGALATAADEIRESTGATVHLAPFDVTDPTVVDAAIAGIEETVGPVQICVNNAGMQKRAPFTDFAVEDWNTLLATNVTSAFLVGQAVARRMQPRGRGKIINIASLQSEVSRPGIAPYAATKGAIKMLTRGMCGDLAGSGICGRWGNVEDLIGTLVYLASDASDFVNGQIVYVDGGMLSVL